MARDTFIRAIEIWVPTPDRTRLSLKSGFYGELDYFERVSRGMQFAYDEGLPGKTWARGHPVVLKDLGNSYFKRGDAALSVGLSCAVAVPSFAGADLTAVTVFFCGNDAHHVGAIEVWHAAPGEPQMTLDDGYFGRAEKFEFAARHTEFSPKVGLPGIVWDSGMPLVMEDLGRAEQFVRRDGALKVGINRGVGIPVPSRGRGAWALTFLSAVNSPIANRVEVWVPDQVEGTFRFEQGYCENGAGLHALLGANAPPLDVGPMGEARLSAVPVLVTPPAPDAEAQSPFACLLVLPLLGRDGTRAVLVLRL
ncbi:hypothetical protein B2G71_12680 [Novosphingobium sp. PC22D]|uniref:GAF domain-containing protein n=1 Tax=Novosphingobium sp. PC22D TaxID=1962403 RepID=UPI000BF1CC36|nr:GAF domain-containing protein [Novosphingobium sp. PC22D]PEQ12344.1 hypothetical protein B2G71_12680 [Novosphingobium sp. PC22D]